MAHVRKSTGIVVAWVVALAAPLLLTECGKVPTSSGSNLPGMPEGVPGANAACPTNIADANAMMAANFGLEANLESKVKAALAAGADLQKIAADLEDEVTRACESLAKDLGVNDDASKPAQEGPGKRAEAACNAAVKAIAETKAKAQGKIVIEAKPARCMASVSAMSDCAAKCDANLKPASLKAECEGGKLGGRCDGECKGECAVEAGAKCEGSCSANCSGECKADFSGKCDGTCNGKCDGKNTKGKCTGKCEGRCDGKASGNCAGECKGECSGSCTMKAKGQCSGTCSGSCSVELKEPKCSGELKPPQMSAECKAHCNAQVKSKLECTPGHVLVKAEGSLDAPTAEKLKAALEKDLPMLLMLHSAVKSQITGLANDVLASLEGVKAAASATSSAAPGALKAGACIGASLEAQAKASVSIDVSLKASASASGSVGAG